MKSTPKNNVVRDGSLGLTLVASKESQWVLFPRIDLGGILGGSEREWRPMIESLAKTAGVKVHWTVLGSDLLHGTTYQVSVSGPDKKVQTFKRSYAKFKLNSRESARSQQTKDMCNASEQRKAERKVDQLKFGGVTGHYMDEWRGELEQLASFAGVQVELRPVAKNWWSGTTYDVSIAGEEESDLKRFEGGYDEMKRRLLQKQNDPMIT